MKRNITWHFDAWEDYMYWQKSNKKLFQKINTLIKEISRDPFSGTGKPEPLRHALDGFWSRRINREHRLVYQVSPQGMFIIQCRYHY
jgi:toxin YoeB